MLVADDEPLLLRLVELHLARWGFEAISVNNGAEAWEILKREDGPRMAILDWVMPVLDGVEVCRRVRERPTGSSYIYMVLLTARDERADVVAGLDAGADDYLTKPFDPQELQLRLLVGERILSLQNELMGVLRRHEQAEQSLQRARKREGQIGFRIQQALLLGEIPSDIPGVNFAAFSVPSSQVDGDFYDFLCHGDGLFDVVVGDVMGKGVPAALASAATRSAMLRALSQLTTRSGPNPGYPSRLPEPAEIINEVHAAMTRKLIELESFETLCYARFHLSQRRVAVVDCGHTPLLHFHHSTGECDRLYGENMPLGSRENEVYTEVAVSFEPGDLFLFYSDGITEARSPTGPRFGLDRLVHRVNSFREENPESANPEALLDYIRRGVIEFTGSEHFEDDLTCVAVEILSDL